MKYKARLVAQGIFQRPEFAYNNTFAPVMRYETLRTVLALAAVNGREICQMDVKYLNGTMLRSYTCSSQSGLIGS